MFNQNTPTRGSLLVSEPFILDPNFERSVIMLCEHNEDGTLGLVLNHRSNLLLSDVIEGIQVDIPIYIGGPVQNDALFFLHRTTDLAGGTPVTKDIALGRDLNQAIFLVQEGILTPDNIKFFLGYSGWSPKQLEEEIAQNSWAVHNSFDSHLPFVLDGDALWKQALISLGPKYAHVANFPKNPSLN